jgi:hypothetical protein
MPDWTIALQEQTDILGCEEMHILERLNVKRLPQTLVEDQGWPIRGSDDIDTGPGEEHP